MNHNKKMFIKNRIERSHDDKINRRAFRIITKHHPDKTYRTTADHILLLFHNLTDICYLELFKLVKNLKDPDQIDLSNPEPNRDTSLYDGFLDEVGENFVRDCSKLETRLLYTTYLQEKMKA